MLAPFDAAWSVLKALPEDQLYTSLVSDEERRSDLNPEYAEMIRNLPGMGGNFSTMHPAIRGMIDRDERKVPRKGLGSYRLDRTPDDATLDYIKFLIDDNPYHSQTRFVEGLGEDQRRRGSAVDDSTQAQFDNLMERQELSRRIDNNARREGEIPMEPPMETPIYQRSDVNDYVNFLENYIYPYLY